MGTMMMMALMMFIIDNDDNDDDDVADDDIDAVPVTPRSVGSDRVRGAPRFAPTHAFFLLLYFDYYHYFFAFHFDCYHSSFAFHNSDLYLQYRFCTHTRFLPAFCFDFQSSFTFVVSNLISSL